MPRTQFQSSMSVSPIGRSARTDACVVDHDGRRPAEPVLRDLGELGHIVDPTDVAACGQRLATGVDDGVRGCARGCFVDVAAHHPAAAAGELDGEGGADPTACAGDHRRGVVTAFPGRAEDAHCLTPPAD